MANKSILKQAKHSRMCISFLLKPDQAKGKPKTKEKTLITSFKDYSRKQYSNQWHSCKTQTTHTKPNSTCKKKTTLQYSNAISLQISNRISKTTRAKETEWEVNVGNVKIIFKVYNNKTIGQNVHQHISLHKISANARGRIMLRISDASHSQTHVEK